jgi:hypothetical protein
MLASSWFFFAKSHEWNLLMIDLPAQSCLDGYQVSAIKDPAAYTLAYNTAKCKAQTNDRKIAFLGRELTLITWAWRTALIVGFLLAEEGFRRWHRIQVLQDTILENQARRSELPPADPPTTEKESE